MTSPLEASPNLRPRKLRTCLRGEYTGDICISLSVYTDQVEYSYDKIAVWTRYFVEVYSPNVGLDTIWTSEY